MRKGAMAPPIDDPLSKSAAANARSRFGNHSDTAFVAPGQFADSPAPSRNRMIAKLDKPRAKEVQIDAMEYQMIEMVSPRRVPILSMNRPQIDWPNEYATRNAIRRFA